MPARFLGLPKISTTRLPNFIAIGFMPKSCIGIQQPLFGHVVAVDNPTISGDVDA
jgi:hypothetical protein